MDDLGRGEHRRATDARPWIARVLRGLSIVSLVTAAGFLALALDPFYGMEDRLVVIQQDLVRRLALSFGALTLAVVSWIAARAFTRRSRG